MSDIFDEIQEEATEERWLNLWKKYQNYVYGTVLLCVLATAGNVLWKRHQASKAAEASEKYMQALQSIHGNQIKTALGFLEEIPLNYSGAYKDLSRFLVASLLHQEGDNQGAQDVYRSIVNDPGAGTLYSHLALLRLAYMGFDRENSQSLLENLKPLTKSSSPWKFSALELTALLWMKEGNKLKAEETLKQLLAEAKDQKDTPPFIVFRAESLLRALKIEPEKREIQKENVKAAEKPSAQLLSPPHPSKQKRALSPSSKKPERKKA